MGLKKGPWTPEEDKILFSYIQMNGHGCWPALPELAAGLLRCGKSCLLRWPNYLRPDIKRRPFTQEVERMIVQLHAILIVQLHVILGNRWLTRASQLPWRTGTVIKNLWSSHLRRRLLKMGLDPSTHAPKEEANPSAAQGSEALALTRHKAKWENADSKQKLGSRENHSSCPLTLWLLTTSITVQWKRWQRLTIIHPPSDYFLKIWNSEAGDAFVNKTHLLSGGGDDPVLSSEIPPTSVSSLCCASTQNSCDQSLNRNEKVKDKGSQHCSSASFGWSGDCNVKTPEWVRQNKAIQELVPEHAVHCTGFEASFFWIFLIMMTRITTAVAFNKISVQVFSSNLLSHGICT